uniref:Putative F-box/FBD/LRR-repeat protein At5g22610 n=1 Tax=Anthurium amnicola TaxID=1678845 RepID=A0A1D1ZEF9_9ARAE
MQYVLFHSLHVSTPALTRLAARDFGFLNCKLLVSAPNLRSLHYRPMSSDMGCVLLNLDSVVDAFIDINRPDTECVGTPTGELLKALHKVRALTLHFWGAPDQYLSPEKELWNRLPSFQNLKRLDLCIWLSKDHTEAIIYILQHAPNLETLVIESDGPERCKLERRFGLSERQWGNWIPRKEDFNIALRQLKPSKSRTSSRVPTSWSS